MTEAKKPIVLITGAPGRVGLSDSDDPVQNHFLNPKLSVGSSFLDISAYRG
jgi:hypothetical protein